MSCTTSFTTTLQLNGKFNVRIFVMRQDIHNWASALETTKGPAHRLKILHVLYHLFTTTSQLNGKFNACIFVMRHDINNWASTLETTEGSAH